MWVHGYVTVLQCDVYVYSFFLLNKLVCDRICRMGALVYRRIACLGVCMRECVYVRGYKIVRCVSLNLLVITKVSCGRCSLHIFNQCAGFQA